MKKISVLMIVLLWGILDIAAAQIKSQVKESFELTSIAFRLAGASEYVNNELAGYAADIDHYFGKYKNHPLISYIEELREKHVIGYDAVPLAAGCIDIKGGKVIISPRCNVAKLSEIDDRWTEQSFKTFVRLLNDFYGKAKFNVFYKQHVDLYRIAEDRLNGVLVNLNADWFTSLFGKDMEEPLVVASLCNGASNYSFARINEEKEYGIVIGSGADQEGLPAYDEQMVFFIVHECLHHYINPRISSNWALLDSPSQVIYSHVKDKMAKLAYGSSQTTMTEWLINLLSTMYLQDNPGVKSMGPDYTIARLQTLGFVWMERSMKFMEHFRNNRDTYKTIDDYMPQIIGFVNQTAAHFDQVINEFDNREPYVADVFPASGSILASGIDTIKISFSKPMSTSHGMRLVDDKQILFPKMKGKPFWKDAYTFCIVLDESKLEKGKIYGFKLNHLSFQAEKKYPLKEDYSYTFKTSDQ